MFNNNDYMFLKPYKEDWKSNIIIVNTYTSVKYTKHV